MAYQEYQCYPEQLGLYPMEMAYGHQPPYNLVNIGRDYETAESNFQDYESCYENNTPLHHAVFQGDLETVQKLVEEGANIDAISYFRSPLLIACGSLENPFLGPHKSLLEADRFGRTPPRTPYYHQEIAKYLIEKGANINFRDGANRTALDLSCEAGNLEMATHFLNLDAEISKKSFTTLHYSVKGGNPAIVRLILEKGKDSVNMSCSYDGTALEMAITRMWDHPHVCEMVQSLLAAGASVKSEYDMKEETPLDLVCMNEASPSGLLKLLLEYNADINLERNKRVSPLDYVFGRYLHLSQQGNNTLKLSETEVEKMIIVLKHVFKIRRNNQDISLVIEKMLRKIYELIDTELVLMDNPISELDQLSLLEIFSKDIDILGRFLECQGRHDIVCNQIEKLPFFGCSLNNKLLEARSRRLAVLAARDVFYKYQIPLEIVEKFFQLLTTSDLQNLGSVIKNQNVYGKKCYGQDQRNVSEWFADLNPCKPPSFIFAPPLSYYTELLKFEEEWVRFHNEVINERYGWRPLPPFRSARPRNYLPNLPPPFHPTYLPM